MCKKDLQALLQHYLLCQKITDESELNDCLKNISAHELVEQLSKTRNLAYDNFTVIHLAVARGHSHIIKLLLQQLNHQQRFEILKLKSLKNHSPIYVAVLSGNEEAVKLALTSLSAGEVYELLKIQTVGGDTAVHAAAYNGRTSIMSLMLEALSRDQVFKIIQIKRKGGYTALSDAILAQKHQSVEYLLRTVPPELRITLLLSEIGAELYTALHISAMNDNTGILAFVMDQFLPTERFKLMKKSDYQGHSLMHCAMSSGKAGTAAYLLKLAQKDNCLHSLMEIQDAFGFTPIHIAAQRGNLDVLKLTLDFQGPDQNQHLLKIGNNRGNTAAELALELGHERVAEFLHVYSLKRKTHKTNADLVRLQHGEQKLHKSAMGEEHQLCAAGDLPNAGPELSKITPCNKPRNKSRKNWQQKNSDAASTSKQQGNDVQSRDPQPCRSHTKRKWAHTGDDEAHCSRVKIEKRLDASAQRHECLASEHLAGLGERHTELSERVDGHEQRISITEVNNQITRENLDGISHRVEDLEENVAYKEVPIGGHQQPDDELALAVLEEGEAFDVGGNQ